MGWLHSPDGSEQAWVLLKAGENRVGYFTNKDILDQATKAMDILERHFPNEEHVLVFDNATTHTKCADGVLSATQMTKKILENFQVETNVHNKAGLMYSPDASSRSRRFRWKMPNSQMA